jgi:hypothetical protein
MKMTQWNALCITNVDRLSYGLIIYFNDGQQAFFPTASLHASMDNIGVIQFSLTDTLFGEGSASVGEIQAPASGAEA